MFVRPFDADQVVARLLVAMLHHDVAVLGQLTALPSDWVVTFGLPSPKSQISSPAVVPNVAALERHRRAGRDGSVGWLAT